MSIFRKRQLTLKEFDKVCDQQCDKIIKKLKKRTPKGQIRFMLLNYGKLKRKIMRKVNLPKIDTAFEHYLDRTSLSHALYFTSSFNSFPPYAGEANTMDISLYYRSNPLYEVALVFNGNDLDSNPNCAKDLITYWFETFVLPQHKKIKNTPSPASLPTTDDWFLRTYSYAPLIHALAFLEHPISQDECKELFEEICTKHNCNIYTPEVPIPNSISLY